jgi:hypothetical protein
MKIKNFQLKGPTGELRNIIKVQLPSQTGESYGEITTNTIDVYITGPANGE